MPKVTDAAGKAAKQAKSFLTKPGFVIAVVVVAAGAAFVASQRGRAMIRRGWNKTISTLKSMGGSR